MCHNGDNCCTPTAISRVSRGPKFRKRGPVFAALFTYLFIYLHFRPRPAPIEIRVETIPKREDRRRVDHSIIFGWIIHCINNSFGTEYHRGVLDNRWFIYDKVVSRNCSIRRVNGATISLLISRHISRLLVRASTRQSLGFSQLCLFALSPRCSRSRHSFESFRSTNDFSAFPPAIVLVRILSLLDSQSRLNVGSFRATLTGENIDVPTKW